MKIKATLTFLLMVLVSGVGLGDVPTLHLHSETPWTPSCQYQLDHIQIEMIRVSMQESLLYKAVGITDAEKYYANRAKSIKKAKDFIPNRDNCQPDNIKTLGIVLSEWQYDYAIDMTKAIRGASE